jgi:hypothetical protein
MNSDDLISRLLAEQPEPVRHPDGVEISEYPIAVAQAVGGDTLADLVRARIAQGAERYGGPLWSDDGRDPCADAVQEAVDLLIYLCRLGVALRQRRVGHALVDEAISKAANLLDDTVTVALVATAQGRHDPSLAPAAALREALAETPNYRGQ